MSETNDLFDLTVRQLFEKFGAGSHKPGSGSAAAMQALIAAEMLTTVIALTLEPERLEKSKKYRECAETLRVNRNDLLSLKGELTSLFHEDAAYFDQVINCREARDKEPDLVQKHLLERQSVELLLECCDIPLEIARKSYLVLEIGMYVFEHGFRTARGDSAVGIRSAISAMEGCLAIIQLNLQKCIHEERIEELLESCNKLKRTILKSRIDADAITEALENEVASKLESWKPIAQECRHAADHANSRTVVEQKITAIQVLINRKLKRADGTIVESSEMIKELGYGLVEVDLGDMLSDRGNLQIGGMIDPVRRLIQINSTLSAVQRRFTIAHELGHAVLHPKLAAHRDIPLDHQRSDGRRDSVERQADQFAALWLMPLEPVTSAFLFRFGSDHIILNEDTAIALNLRGLHSARQRLRSLRGLARVVAATDQYGGSQFESLASAFKVSPEAMAIRLEELNLIEF